MWCWRIRPERSAQENLWDCIRVNTLSFKSKVNKKGLTLTYEEWSDIIQEVSIAAYKRFMTKLLGGRYNRKYSFYLNVRSCVYMVFYQVVQLYLAKYVHPKANSYDRLEPDKIEYMVNSTRMPLYKESIKGPKETEEEEAFWEYLYSCKETGLPVDRRNPDYLMGLYMATGQRPDLTITLERKRIAGGNVFGELYMFGNKMFDTLEGKTRLPAGSYKLHIEYSYNLRCNVVFIEYSGFKRRPYFIEGNNTSYKMGHILLKTEDDRKQLLSIVNRGKCTLEIKDCPGGMGVEPMTRPEVEPPRPDCANQSK